MNHLENPFPLSAVSVFGTNLGPTAELSGMREVRAQLFAYLARYPDQRCCLALEGGHGSGKTHLFNWLTTEIRNLTSADAEILYVKPNSPDITELYRQLLSKLSRDRLLQVQRDALVAIGARRASAVKATEAESKGIQDFDSLSRAFRDKVLDANEVQIELRETLSQATGAADVSRRVAAALGLLEDTTYGEAAFAWLSGATVKPLPNEALEAEIFAGDGDMALKAIPALATLGALFKLADTPLVLLIDEMEKFLSVEDAARKSSNLKEIIEQVGSQGTAIVMAGTTFGWQLLPRDVGPRLLQRKPVPIGRLTATECRDVLEVHILARTNLTPALSSESLAAILDLSGANAREILRIANRAFEEVGGDLTKFTGDVLTRAAQASGTLTDRRELAYQMIEQTASELKLTTAPGIAPVDCLVLAPQGPSLAIAFALAGDPSGEAGISRILTSGLLRSGGRADATLVIAVGYSSERVRQILRSAAKVIVFDEATLKDHLREEFGRLLVAPAPSSAEAPNAQVSDALKQMQVLLERVERSRVEADLRIAELLTARAKIAAEPERLEAEARTRSELRDGLDALSNSLTGEEPNEERRALRRLLIANEANVGNPNFDYLGSLYLDVLDLERLEYNPNLKDRAEIPASIGDRLRRLRTDLLAAMRRALAPPASPSFQNRNVRAAISVGFAAAFFLTNLTMSELSQTSRAITFYAFVTMLVGIAFFVTSEILVRPSSRYSSLIDRYKKIRHDLHLDN